MRIKTYQTVSIATEELRKNGFDANFVMEEEKLKCMETDKIYAPKDMKIMEFHRFEGDSDPADNSIVYAVACKDGLKGTIVSAYGMYGSVHLNDFMKQVKVADKNHVAGPIHQQTYY